MNAAVSCILSGILHSLGIGQTPQAWFVRGHPAVQQVFRSIWGTDELITSMDGVCYPEPVKAIDLMSD
jgi:hypothetical protein